VDKTGLHVSRLWLGMTAYGSKAWRPWILEPDEITGLEQAYRPRPILRHS
jgi:hypothetical protein